MELKDLARTDHAATASAESEDLLPTNGSSTPATFDRSLSTRKICVTGLSLAWSVGATTCGGGVYLVENVTPATNHEVGNDGSISIGYAVRLSSTSSQVLPLAINVVVTELVETTGFIHTASLRWALQREGRLAFNSNVRLLTSATTWSPNGFMQRAGAAGYCVRVFFIGDAHLLDQPLVYDYDLPPAYGLPPTNEVPPTRAITGISVFVLGLSILCLAAVSTYALVSSRIPTWSSNPLDTAVACLHTGCVALHCAELVMNLSRNEIVWRSATSERDCHIEAYNSVRAAFTSWQTVFLFKPAMHWLFSLSISVQDGFDLWAPQMLYLSLLIMVFTALVTVLSTWRPAGPQPASFGHLQTIADLINEWSLVFHRAHKDDGDPCHAGTSTKALEPVKTDMYYAGSIGHRQP